MKYVVWMEERLLLTNGTKVALTLNNRLAICSANRLCRGAELSGGIVLRITVEESPCALLLTLEGRLVGPWVEELRRLCQEHNVPGKEQQVTIDLCGLTAMETAGQGLLEELFHRGATLRCSDVMNQYLVEQMARSTKPFQETSRPCQGFPARSELARKPEDLPSHSQGEMAG